jgi:hypothetical protein
MQKFVGKREVSFNQKLVPWVLQRGNFWIFYVCYFTLLHLPLVRFHCVGGCWDRTQDCCNFSIDILTL